MLGRILKDLFAPNVRLRPGQTAFQAGVEAYKAGELAAAAEHFAATLRAEPEHLEAHSYAGGIDLRTGRFREALGHFERARMLDPRNAECHFGAAVAQRRSEEHTSELQSLRHLVCRLLLEKKKQKKK